MPEYKQSTRPTPGSLKLVEMMETVQGEGLFIGCPSVFMRTGMCNLSCPGCDTVWDDWTETKVEEVAARIKAFKSKHIVFTGGEPTLWQNDLALLAAQLPEHIITIETNGAVPILNPYLLSRVDLWSFSPKVGSLGYNETFSKQVVRDNLHKTWKSNQIKYVLDPFIQEHIESVFSFHAGIEAPPDERVFFQPYDRDCLVNTIDPARSTPGLPISIRQAPLNESSYAKDLAELTRVVLHYSGCRFRVLPQLHKLLKYR